MHTNAQHWAAAAEGMMVMMAGGDGSTGAAEMDEAMPLLAPLAPPPTPPLASAAPEGHGEEEEAAGEEDSTLHVMRAPVLEDGTPLPKKTATNPPTHQPISTAYYHARWLTLHKHPPTTFYPLRACRRLPPRPA